MRCDAARRAVSGLTLLEALCTLAIVAMVMSAVLGVLTTTVRGFERAGTGLRRTRLTAGLVRVMGRDMASATAVRTKEIAALQGGAGLSDGSSAALAFFTTHSFSPRPMPSPSGLRRVAYILRPDSDGESTFTLFRRERPYVPGRADADGDAADERLIEGLTSWRLRFYDGSEWHDGWQRVTLPYLVRLDVAFETLADGTPAIETLYLAPKTDPDGDLTPVMGKGNDGSS